MQKFRSSSPGLDQDHGGPELQSLIEIDNAMADLRYIVSIDTKRMYSTDCPYHTLHALQKLYWIFILNEWIISYSKCFNWH